MRSKMYDYEKSDPTFIEDLHSSDVWVWQVARYLRDTGGFHVTIPPLQVRPSADQMNEFSDDGDLLITQRVEVKHRPGIEFSCKDDFPYDSIIVDVSHAWDKAMPKPYLYVILSASGSCGIFILGTTHRHWVKESRWDKGKKREREFYFCPIDLVTFREIPPTS
jgi:hypothetical protein